MGNVLFISDTHFGHRNICKYRPFNTAKEHDEHIIDCWNKVVKKRDVVWVLGDMCIKNKLYDMNDIIDRLTGQIHLITGNHCHLPYYTHKKIKMFPGLLSKYGFWLSHCPIHTKELRGKRNIHGHVHGKSLPDNNYINVCCEAVNYTPLPLEFILREEATMHEDTIKELKQLIFNLETAIRQFKVFKRFDMVAEFEREKEHCSHLIDNLRKEKK